MTSILTGEFLHQYDRPSWFERAACRGMDTNIFYPDDKAGEDEARSVCSGCPVRSLCLARAMEDSKTLGYNDAGILGGTNARERRLAISGGLDPLADPHLSVNGVGRTEIARRFKRSRSAVDIWANSKTMKPRFPAPIGIAKNVLLYDWAAVENWYIRWSPTGADGATDVA